MLIHWIWLATRPEFTDRDKLALLQQFGDPEDLYYADTQALHEVEGLTEDGIKILSDKDLHEAGKILHACMDEGIQICTFHDGVYPHRLKNIADPPLVLYCKGFLPDLDSRPVIAIVGTRKCSLYGVNIARKIGKQIALCGGIVVSGMAAGIDAAALSGALSANSCAIGILGNGADVVYPKCNRSLYNDTQTQGCLISEFPPGTPPYRWNFPKRNRIISGIANGVLVVEAPQSSGALITARQAAEQGRDVFVIPGNVDVPTCIGSNALLREGAIAVRNGWDVVSEYAALYPDSVHKYDQAIAPADAADLAIAEGNLAKVAQSALSPQKSTVSSRKAEKITIDNPPPQPYSDIHGITATLSDEEKTIVELLRNGELLVDEVIARAGMPAGQVLSLLTLLELQKVLVRKPGKRVALK